MIQNAGDGFAHIEHHMAHLAFVLIAIVTWAIVCLAGAGDGGKRAVERADDIADGNLVGRAGQTEATALALATKNEAGIAKFGKNIVEKLARYMVLLGDFAGRNQLSICNARQMHHGFQAIFALFSQHATPVEHFLWERKPVSVRKCMKRIRHTRRQRELAPFRKIRPNICECLYIRS